jgi:putative ABC transport system ATP-binding protein
VPRSGNRIRGTTDADAENGIPVFLVELLSYPAGVTEGVLNNNGDVVTADDVSHWYAAGDGTKQDVLRGVSLRVAPGEMLAIVGPSGSGKTTLLLCLSGLASPRAGKVAIDGLDLASMSASGLARYRRGRIGFVFQDYNLIPALTASQNVAVPARLARRPADRRTVNAALDAVGLLPHADRRPNELSGGQQQRVAIARVLVTQPKVVFADEPTGALDTVAGAAVLDLLRRTASGERSVVMVTHDLEAAARADRVLVLRNGRIHRELVRPHVRAVFDAVEHAASTS